MNDPYGWVRRLEEMLRQHEDTIRRLTANPISDHVARIDTMPLSKAMLAAERFPSDPSFSAKIAGVTSEALHQMSKTGAVEETFRVAAERDRAMWKSVETLRIPDSTLAAANFNKLMSTVDLASASMSSVKWDELERVLGASKKWQRDLQFLTNEFAYSHSALIELARRPEAGFADVPEFVTRVPTENLFVHARTIRELSPHDEYEQDEEAQSIISEQDIDEEVDAIFEALLPKLNQHFLKMLHGADEAWRAKLPDWPRHVASSSRELFKGVFHNVAPDAEVEKLITDPATERDPKGHPTRSIKITYLCRNIRIPEYRRTVEADLTAAVKCLKIIEDGVHSASGKKFERQAEMLRRRVRVAVRHMLNIWGYSNN